MSQSNPAFRSAKARAAARGPATPTTARINELIRAGKAGWLGLLAYLAYVGVTLLGVIDADFFMPEKQTELPLIGVSIPTNLFFWIAPGLGTLLFAYLHHYLLKLWTALAEAPAQIDKTPLGDQITPWLVADYALSQRLDGALRPAPLRRAANFVSLVLVFTAAPLVLAGFWWRSMPKHDEAMTVLGCGLPLFFAIYVGVTSWVQMRRLARGKSGLPLWGKGITWGWRAGFIVIAVLGWMTTEGTLEHYARVTGYFDDRQLKLAKELERLDEETLKARFEGITEYPGTYDVWYLAERELETHWWMQTWLPRLLIPAQLAGTVFVETPSGWLDHDQARHAFWLQECKAEGLTPSLCGHRLNPDAEYAANMANLRAEWCAKTLGLHGAETAKSCEEFFNALSARIAGDWKSARQNDLDALPDRDLSEVDLRFADLSAAYVYGANLSGVRMEGACLNRAQMEGANLINAQMERANLFRTRLELVDLSGAEMEGALLDSTKFDSADLSDARLEAAFFSDSDLSVAKNLSFEQLARAFVYDVDDGLPAEFGPVDEILPENWSDGGLQIYDSSKTNMLDDHLYLGPIDLRHPRFCEN